MASSLDKVHTLGMSPNNSTYLAVDAYYDTDNNKVSIEPPIEIVFEGDQAHVAVTQEGLAARYHDDELQLIGEGSSVLGLKRVIGDIAKNGNLARGAIKPLHPNLLVGSVVLSAQELPAAHRDLTA